jgi:hypothetical protein
MWLQPGWAWPPRGSGAWFCFGWNPFSEVIDDGGGKSFGKKTMLIV